MTIVAVEKQLCIKYAECVFAALDIQHAKRMRHMTLFVASPALPYFSTLSRKRHDSQENGTGIMNVF